MNALLDYSVIVLYFLAVVTVGLYCSRREKTSENYLMGRRQMHFVAIGIVCIMALPYRAMGAVTTAPEQGHGFREYSNHQFYTLN